MPKYEIPKFSYEELLAGAGYTPPADVIGAAQKGASLIDTVSQIKERKLKQQKEIEEIERKLAAQELLAKTVEGKPEIERKKAALLPLAPKRAIGPETATGQVPMEPESPEYKKGMESVTSEESKRNLLATGVRAGLSPEKAIEGLYPDTGRGSTFEQQTNFSIVDPATGQQKTVKGLQRSDGVYHPVTGQKVTDLSELPLSGYKVSTNVVGRDPNTNLPIEYNDQTRQYTSGGQVYNGIIFPKLENAPASVAKSVTDYKTAKDQLVMITDAYKDKLTGPIAGRYKTMEAWIGSNDPDAARFMSYVQTFQNYLIKAITGAQMSEPEAKRILGQMPQFKDNPAAFIAKLQASAENIDLSMKNTLEAAEASGYAIKGMPYEQASKLVADKFNLPVNLTPKGEPILKNKLEAMKASNYVFKDPATEDRVRQIAEELSGIPTQQTTAPKGNDIGAALRAILPKVK